MNHEQFAIKSIVYNQQPFTPTQKSQKKLSNAIIEYCMYKLCSALKIGPHTPAYFGFDLLIFNSTVEFSMEKCVNKKILSQQ